MRFIEAWLFMGYLEISRWRGGAQRIKAIVMAKVTCSYSKKRKLNDKWKTARFVTLSESYYIFNTLVTFSFISLSLVTLLAMFTVG